MRVRCRRTQRVFLIGPGRLSLCADADSFRATFLGSLDIICLSANFFLVPLQARLVSALVAFAAIFPRYALVLVFVPEEDS